MECTAKKIIVPCYIGETKFKAGIFLSRQIVDRKKYAESLRLMKFGSYQEAREAFLKAYGEITGEDIRLNYLYEVRSREIYSVLSTPYYVGVYETHLRELFYQESCLKHAKNVVSQDCLSYEEAIKTARERFARIWHNSGLYIDQKIPLNSVIKLSEMIKRDKARYV